MGLWKSLNLWSIEKIFRVLKANLILRLGESMNHASKYHRSIHFNLIINSWFEMDRTEMELHKPWVLYLLRLRLSVIKKWFYFFLFFFCIGKHAYSHHIFELLWIYLFEWYSKILLHSCNKLVDTNWNTEKQRFTIL